MRATPFVMACLAAASACLCPSALAAEERPQATGAGYDFSRHFTTPIRSPLSVSEGALAGGAVSVEAEAPLSKPSALRIDCGRQKDRVVIVNFAVPGARLDALRGRPLLFRCQVKRLKGAGEVSVGLRCFGDEWKYLLGSQRVSFSGEPGRWGPMALRCMVPETPDVKSVDFHFAVENSPDPPVVLVDDCVVEVTSEGQAEAVSGFAAYAAGSSVKPLPIVAGGKAAATLVIAQNPTAVVQYAVQELNEHIALSTGVTLPVAKEGQPVAGPAVHIGETALTRRLGLAPAFLAPDHWVARRVGDALILSGGDDDHGLPMEQAYSGLIPYGTLYAAYEFLERAVGVRWYWPGDLGRDVPKRAALSIGNAKWQGAPSYETRFCWYAMPKDPELPEAEVWKWWRRLRWGGAGGSAIANHSFGHWNRLHGAAHPDWFALQRDGRRLNGPDATGNDTGHLCLTNPEVLAQAIAEKRERFDKSPWDRYGAVMPGDSDDLYYCQCEKCLALIRPGEGRDGFRSHAVWSFVNQVAAEVRKSHPDKRITCCAYGGYAAVPKDVYLEPNVAVTLCAWQFPAGLWNPSLKTDYVKWLASWSSRAADLYIWDYWNIPRYSKGLHGAPAIFPHAIQEWLLLDRGRVKGHAIELSDIDSAGTGIGAWADWVMDSLNVYVGMRLLWDTDQNVDAILNEYYERFYGPAGPMVKRFYQAMEAAYGRPSGKGPEPTWDWNTCWIKTYPPKLVAETMGYLRQAVRATEGKEPYQARAKKTLDGFLPFERASRRFAAATGKAIANAALRVPETAAPPAIDGALDDASWKSAAVAGGFVDSFNAADLHSGTEVRILRDARTLYVGIRAGLPSPEYKKDLPERTVDANVWDQESAEVFLVQGVRKYQFLIGPGSIYADNHHPDRRQEFKMEMMRWNCRGVRYATDRGDGEWTAEIAIPLASLELAAPTKEDPWRVNFCRNHFVPLNDAGRKSWKQELSTWRPTFGPFDNVERYGVLWFGG